MTKILINLLAACMALQLASAFTAPFPRATPLRCEAAARPSPPAPIRGIGARRLQMAPGGDSSDTPPRKRRTRKDGKQFDPPPEPATAEAEPEPAPAPSPPKQNVVTMQVRDIRDVVSGAPEPSEDTAAVDDILRDDNDNDDDELADDEEWEYYDVDEEGNEIIVADNEPVGAGGRGQDESIEQLLADARSMRASSSSEGQMSDDGEGSSVKDTVFEVISTIVTIDFFVVIGLLAWFLAGIFFRSAFGNDAVQIAFNNNFERVTQPALGILMIGSVAGALGNKDDVEVE
ncbi:hypothetical protein ACHAXT_004117 [Thalassiosira profunda]